MVKVSITLPNKAQITFESEEPEVIHEIVGMVLRDLPRELMLSVASEVSNGNGNHAPEPEKSNGVPAPEVEERSAAQLTAAPPATSESPSPTARPKTVKQSTARKETAASSTPPARPQDLSPAEQQFVAFCRSVNPLGDMRRVVVAAEGASRFLSMPSVDAEELGRLFDLAGWKRPHSFVQTMRNAARSKFRWLERIPGRSGHYSVSDLGRAVALES